MNAQVEPQLIRLDIGCGKNKKEGFFGVDVISFAGVDLVLNVGASRWPYADGTVEEIHTSHFVEHLKPLERIHFVNEAYRVLRKGGKITVIVPHWASCRAYGDMTHQWPPVSEMWFYYLNKDWRATNAPHNDAEHMVGGYSCDFDAGWAYGMHPTLISRNPEYQQFAYANYKESIQDIHATLTEEMTGGFQPVAFQVNFQQGSTPVVTTGLVWVERPQFRVQQRFVLPANARILFKSKRVGETMFLKPSFDFISALGPTETISTAVVTATVYTGVDPNPSAIISGAAAISGTQVTQLVTGGVLGTIYGLTCTVTTSLGQTLNAAGFFSVDPPLV